jgi:6-phosphogluconolactonase
MTDKASPQLLSRRYFLKGTATLALTHSVWSMAQTSAKRMNTGKTLAYIGTYTGAIGKGSNGEGIYLCEMNPGTGELSPPNLVATTSNPSWIAIHPSGKFLYAANEIADHHGTEGPASGAVSAFAIDRTSGNLSPLNTVSSEGAGPAHLSVDASGKYAFVANYGSGSIAVLPIETSGSLGSVVDVHRDSGSVGSTQATNAPPGSFAISGHDAPHAHMISPDPQNKFVLSTDLGQDRIYVYRFNHETGKLTPANGAGFVPLPTGDGPRHFAFHPNGHWLYAIQEESSTIVFFAYNPASGDLASQQMISALPPGFAGSSYASEILVSPDGNFLYAANRLHDTIAVFSINKAGRLKHLGESSTLGDYPGQCRIDPSGNFLYACNRRSDSITAFRIDRDTGLLTFTGQYTPVGSPASITFLG